MIKSRRIRWAVPVARIGDKRSANRVLVRRSDVNRPLGRHGRRWEAIIKMDLQAMG
jgi:hypothetical protein